jgi:hypothetical protein
MRTRSSPPSAIVSALLILALGWLLAVPAWAGSGVGVGTVTHLSGVLSDQKANGETKVLCAWSKVDEGDLLVSEAGTFARIKFIDGGNLVIRPKTRVRIDKYAFDKDNPAGDNVALNLIKGGLRSITGVVGKRSPDKDVTVTASATIGIRGTHYGLLLCLEKDDCDDIKTLSGEPPSLGLHIDVLEGSIVATNAAGSQVIGAGQFGYVKDAKTAPILVPAEQGVRVTVPPSMVADTGNGMTVGRGSNDNKCSVK